MDHPPPFLQLSIGSSSIDGRVRVESASSVAGTLVELYSAQASALHKRPLHAKGSGIPSYFRSSNLSTPGVFFLRYSYSFSIIYRTIGFFVCNYQLSPMAFCVCSSQTLQELLSHPNQVEPQFARFCSDRQFGVHGTSARSTASAATEEATAFRPFATGATDSRLQFWPHQIMVASLSRHEAKQGACLSFPLESIYVNSDIKSSSIYPRRRKRRITSKNTTLELSGFEEPHSILLLMGYWSMHRFAKVLRVFPKRYMPCANYVS